MDIELKDYFKIDDNHSKIRGFLVCKDENGKYLVRKENMIVKSGREMILKAITKTGELDIKNPVVKFSSNPELTNANMTTLGGIEFPNSGMTNNVVNISSTLEDDLSIKYTIIVDFEKADNNYEINSLGLFFNDKLFSRVVFDTIGLSSNRKLTFTYYIYF